MKKVHIFTLLFLFSALHCFAAFRENILFTVQIDATQMVPTGSSSAQGLATIMLNKKRDSLSINLSSLDISPTFVGIYVGKPGMTGPLLFDLSDAMVGNTLQKRLFGTAVKANIGKLMSDELYLVIGSAASPNGEIRGQIRLATDRHFVADLNGEAVVPAELNEGFGLGSFALTMDGSRMDYKIICQALSGSIVSAKLYKGAAGTIGAEMLDLSGTVTGNVLQGSFPPNPAFVAALMAGEIYLNISTAANPDGEIRAQLLLQRGFSMETFSDGAQMVPPVTSGGKGLGVFRLTPTMDSLFYDIVLDNIVTNVEYMHFHIGYPGQAYAALQIDFTNAIDGHRARGIIKGTALSAASITRMLTSNLTLITHTAAHPMGEIRGHLNRFVHEGLTLQLAPAEGAPSNAYGNGFVSVSGNLDRAYYGWLAGNLSGTPTAARFVEAANGGLLYDLTPFMEATGNAGHSVGVWKNSDVPPFLPSNAKQFDEKKVALQVSTTANPEKEISGIVLPGTVFYSPTTVVGNVFFSPDLQIFPNPACTEIVLESADFFDGKWNLALLNVLGNTIQTAETEVVSGQIKTRVDISGLPNGLYFLTLSDGERTSISRFVKNSGF